MKNINNKGFTLIELIVTILLLSVISIISFVAINGVIEKNKVSNCETLVNNIKLATKEYISDHRYDDDFNVSEMTVKTLIDNDYLVGPVYDPFDNGKELNPQNIKLFIDHNSSYTVNNISVKNGSSEVNCDSGKW